MKKSHEWGTGNKNSIRAHVLILHGPVVHGSEKSFFNTTHECRFILVHVNLFQIWFYVLSVYHNFFHIIIFRYLKLSYYILTH